MRLIECFGGVWSLSEREYKRWLQLRVQDREYNLDNFGKCLGYIAVNAVDFKPAEAQELLDKLEAQKVPKVQKDTAYSVEPSAISVWAQRLEKT